MGQPGFWDNQEKAQTLVNELRTVNAALKPIAELVKGADDLGVLMEFAEADPSPETTAEAMVANTTKSSTRPSRSNTM